MLFGHCKIQFVNYIYDRREMVCESFTVGLSQIMFRREEGLLIQFSTNFIKYLEVSYL